MELRSPLEKHVLCILADLFSREACADDLLSAVSSVPACSYVHLLADVLVRLSTRREIGLNFVYDMNTGKLGLFNFGSFAVQFSLCSTESHTAARILAEIANGPPLLPGFSTHEVINALFLYHITIYLPAFVECVLRSFRKGCRCEQSSRRLLAYIWSLVPSYASALR